MCEVNRVEGGEGEERGLLPLTNYKYHVLHRHPLQDLHQSPPLPKRVLRGEGKKRALFLHCPRTDTTYNIPEETTEEERTAISPIFQQSQTSLRLITTQLSSWEYHWTFL